MAEFVYRHNRITRLTHWINALALVILFMSGLQIFNAFPQLHWGSKAEPDEAFFAISASNDDGDVRGYTDIFGYRFDTTGVLGVQQTDLGPFPRAFPSWITIPGYFWLAGGRRWHFFFGWIFALNGLLYLLYNAVNGHLRKFLLTPKDAARVPAMIAYYLRLRRESPQDQEYNPLQKAAYTSVFLVLTPLVLLSGMAMSPQLDIAFHWLPSMFGGRQAARSVHFLLAFAFALFTFGHVFMVLTTGVLNNMRSMVTGWYREKVPLLASPAATAGLSSALTPAPSLQQGEGDEDAATIKEADADATPPVQSATPSASSEKRGTDDEKEP